MKSGDKGIVSDQVTFVHLSVVGNTISLFSLHREFLSGDSPSFMDSLTSVISPFSQIPDTVRRGPSAAVLRSRIGSATRPAGGRSSRSLPGGHRGISRPGRDRPSPAGTPRVAPVSSPHGAVVHRGSRSTTAGWGGRSPLDSPRPDERRHQLDEVRLRAFEPHSRPEGPGFLYLLLSSIW